MYRSVCSFLPFSYHKDESIHRDQCKAIGLNPSGLRSRGVCPPDQGSFLAHEHVCTFLRGGLQQPLQRGPPSQVIANLERYSWSYEDGWPNKVQYAGVCGANVKNCP